uniref:Cell division cycle associated 3 n=1 Tax=Terrapene triunguis TaxID=2587831 RepID=A0A674ISJ7_9SAUR
VRATEQIQSWDPRSPTLGISRTPMKAVMAGKYMSSPGMWLVVWTDQGFGQNHTLQSISWGIWTFSLWRPLPRLPDPSGLEMASNKVLAASGGTGRSPLSILQDDNSPSTLTPRQGKRHPLLAENLGEWKEVAADPGCSLKSGGRAWNDLNKENQHSHLVEN